MSTFDFSELPGSGGDVMKEKNAGVFGGFNELPGASYVSNVLSIGEPDPWNKFDADQRVEMANLIEDLCREAEASRLPSDPPVIRQYINRAVLSAIEKHQDNYADLKKELLNMKVEILSDNYRFDDYYDEKYGGAK